MGRRLERRQLLGGNLLMSLSIALGISPYNIQYNSLGMLFVICSHCHALHFDCEKLTSSRVNHPKFGMCCLQGQIQLPPFQPFTGILRNYLTGDDYFSREFHNNIQQYNAAFAMTSIEQLSY